MVKEALFYNKVSGGKAACYLCAHRCLISEGEFGFCNVRQNQGGTLYTYSYGEAAAVNVDPIEKKPIFHLLPGTKSFSIACAGCNFRCGFCQNWQISQRKGPSAFGVETRDFSPQEIVELAKKNKCRSISYTYTEPTIFFEYALDTACLAKKEGLYNIFVTNGYMTKEALEAISPYLDASNVDLKFFDDEKYRRICSGSLQPVLDSIALMRKLKIWVEVTTLVVPQENDSAKELKDIAEFLAGLGREIPWHISRFHPDYKMADKPATPVSKLKEAYTIGKEAGLRYVYIGNVLEEEKTFCYNCGKELISRQGFAVLVNRLKGPKCPYCAQAIDGIFE